MATRQPSIFDLIGTGNIPREVLIGRVKKYISVHNAYKATYLKTFLTLLNESFWARTVVWGQDDLKNKWTALKPYTHWRKNLEALENPASNPHLTGAYTSPRQLTPKQLSEYQNNLPSVKSVSSRLSKGKQRYRQGKLERENLQSAVLTPWHNHNPRGDGFVEYKGQLVAITPINVRTGRLVSATAPGKVVNNRYYNVSDLIVDINGPYIRISLRNIPYAADVDAVRPIIPHDTSKWQEKAHIAGVEEATKVYNNLLSLRRK